MIVGFKGRVWTAYVHCQTSCRELNTNQLAIGLVLVRRRHGCLGLGRYVGWLRAQQKVKFVCENKVEYLQE